MVELTDELLVAYVDGQLDAETSAKVETALGRDPEAQEAVRRFAESARLAQLVVDEALHQEVPERLLKVFDHAPARAAGLEDPADRRAAQADRAVSLRKWALPLAASLALAVGLGGGYALWDLGTPRPGAGQVIGAIPTDSPLHRALETTPSGRALAWDDPDGQRRGEIRPLLTFRDDAGRYCREYQSFGGDLDMTRGVIGVACRGGPGTWRHEISVAARPSSEGVYQPAGLGQATLEAYLTELMSGAPLDHAAERAVLEAGWR